MQIFKDKTDVTSVLVKQIVQKILTDKLANTSDFTDLSNTVASILLQEEMIPTIRLASGMTEQVFAETILVSCVVLQLHKTLEQNPDLKIQYMEEILEENAEICTKSADNNCTGSCQNSCGSLLEKTSTGPGE